MRLGTIAAALGALLFTASQAAYAAPAMNLQGAAQSPAGSVDLVRQEGGGGKGGGPGMKSGGGGAKFSGQSGGSKMSGPRAGPKVGVYKGGPKMGAYKGGKAPAYAGKGPRGGDWNRGGKQGYAWKGNKQRHYRYLYPSIGLGLAYGAYNYGDECGWLYRRAQATGSPYWWQRFQECRYSYY